MTSIDHDPGFNFTLTLVGEGQLSEAERVELITAVTGLTFYLKYNLRLSDEAGPIEIPEELDPLTEEGFRKDMLEAVDGKYYVSWQSFREYALRNTTPGIERGRINSRISTTYRDLLHLYKTGIKSDNPKIRGITRVEYFGSNKNRHPGIISKSVVPDVSRNLHNGEDVAILFDPQSLIDFITEHDQALDAYRQLAIDLPGHTVKEAPWFIELKNYISALKLSK